MCLRLFYFSFSMFIITCVPGIILNATYKVHVFSVFTESLLWARRQTLITAVIGMMQEEHGKVQTTLEETISCFFHHCTNIPNKKQLRGRKVCFGSVSRFKPLCGEDMAVSSCVGWEPAVAAHLSEPGNRGHMKWGWAVRHKVYHPGDTLPLGRLYLPRVPQSPQTAPTGDQAYKH